MHRRYLPHQDADCETVDGSTLANTLCHRHETVATGTNDCGLFALAAATSICFKCPGSLKYDQPAMRSYFNACMWNGIMTPLPTSATAVRRQQANKCVEIDIYCSCRLPDNKKERMVLCDKCNIWFHQTCQNVAKSVLSDREEEVWHCKACKRLDVVLVK